MTVALPLHRVNGITGGDLTHVAPLPFGPSTRCYPYETLMEKSHQRSERERLLAALRSRGIAFQEIPSGDGSLLVVPASGAQLLAAFVGGANALWAHPHLESIPERQAFTFGGARTWLAPEGHENGLFFSRDGWHAPPSLDPGRYEPTAARHSGAFAWATIVDTRGADGRPYRLSLTREIGPAPNPLAKEAVGSGLAFVGAMLRCRLKNLHERTLDREIGLWNLVMAKPEATIIIPVRPREAGDPYRDSYYERPLPGRLAEKAGAVTLVGGPPRTKIGVPAARCRGLVAAVGPVEDGAWQLIVNRFPVDPDGVYVDRPGDRPNANGDAVQVYNASESGPLAYFEMEGHGPAVILKQGEEQEHAFETLIFRGPKLAVLAAASHLLEVPVFELGLPE